MIELFIGVAKKIDFMNFELGAGTITIFFQPRDTPFRLALASMRALAA